MEEIAAREPRVRLLRCPREGKVAAQHRAVRETESEVLAFTDANTEWRPDALRKLVRNLADPEVGYVCGLLRLESPDGANLEGVYWRYETWVREQESRASSITAGNGAIYAVRREAYVEDDPKFGHDFGLPYAMEQQGLRAVYDPEAIAVEKPASEPEDEYGRKVRMNARSWGHIVTGRMFGRTRPLYLVELLSHRVLRYSSGICCTCCSWSRTSRCSGRASLYRVLLAGSARRARTRRRGQGAAPASRRAARVLLLPRHAGDGGGPRPLPAFGDAADLGEGEGDAVNRALDVAIAGAGLVVGEPVPRRRRGCDEARGRRAGALPADTGRQGRRGLRDAQAADDGRGRGADGRRLRGRRRATRGSRASARFLRRTSIDELPQLWNVLRGDMSIVGPRPTLRYQVEQYDEHQRRRLEVRPGLTGWAQVNGRAALSWPERIELDVWYVEQPLAAGRPRDPAAHAARALPGDLPRRDRRLAAIDADTLPHFATFKWGTPAHHPLRA